MSTDLFASEVTLSRDVVLNAAAALLEWDARIRDFTGADDLGPDGPAEAAMTLLQAAVRSAEPNLTANEVFNHPFVAHAWNRAEERAEAA